MQANSSQNVSCPVRGYTETAFPPNPQTNAKLNGWVGHQMSSQVKWGPSGSRSTTNQAGGLFPTRRFRKKNKPEATEDELQSDNHVQQRANVVAGTRNRFGGSFIGGGQVLLLSDGRLTPAKDSETLSGLLSPGEVIVGKRPQEGKPEWLQEFARPDHPENARVVSSPELETPDSYESLSSGEVPPSLEQPPLPASPVIHGHNMDVNQRLSPDGSPLSSNAQSRCSMTPLTLPATNIGTRPISSTLNSPRSLIDFTGCYGKSLTFPDSASDKVSRVSNRFPAAQKSVLASSFIEKNARERMATPPATAPASCAEASFAGTPPIVEQVCRKTSPKERQRRQLEYSKLKKGTESAQFTDSYFLGSSKSKHSDQCSAGPCASVTHSPPRGSAVSSPRGSAVSSPRGASEGTEASAFLSSRRGETSLTCLTRPSGLKKLRGAGTENPLDSPRRGDQDRPTAVHCAVSAICAIATTSLSPRHRLPDSPQQVPLPFLLSPTTAEADASYPGEEFPASAPNILECSDMAFGTPVPGWH
ncbi:hypothetical protein TGMAS_251430 [Toxoplasma gondii MAS]|uniref:Uncharacterized protein n=1 Tax=Toxoplasma gondii MAS TaxID=943118 RepID=A0A086PW87_TOXGO|nr:hypothetical protein TGMAS_251430 [Toxoplasma gondii MAS]